MISKLILGLTRIWDHGGKDMSLLAGVRCLVEIIGLIYLDLDVGSDWVSFGYESDLFPRVAAGLVSRRRSTHGKNVVG